MLRSRVVRFGSKESVEFVNAKRTWSDRQGLIFVVEHDTGEPRLGQQARIRRGFGEASPLPGYSPDTIDECESCLSEIELFDESELSLRAIAQCIAAMPPFPAARFAVETALLDLLAQSKGQGIAGLFGQYASSARRCALLDAQAPLRSAQDCLDRGLWCAKLKVGRDWDEELATVRQLRREHPNLELRLDANGSWSLPAAKQNLALLEGLGIEFVEQPVAPAMMIRLAGSRVPIAADESLHSEAGIAALRPLMDDAALRVLVLKPTVLGGFIACLQFQKWAQRHRITTIASHCFEGPVGTAAVAELALALDSSMASGVDQHIVLSGVSDVAVPQLRDRFIRLNTCGLGVELDV